MKQFYTYIYIDPKHCVPVYVGKGNGKRAWAHFKAETRLGRLLRKRQIEGYSTMPHIFEMESEEKALAMEQALIDWYGRADLRKGTLLNLTDGGDGFSGYSSKGIPKSKEHVAKVAKANKGKTNSRKGAVTPEARKSLIKEKLKARWADPAFREYMVSRMHEKAKAKGK